MNITKANISIAIRACCILLDTGNSIKLKGHALIAGQRVRNLGILFADLEKTFTRATSRAQADGIQPKNFGKSAFALCQS